MAIRLTIIITITPIAPTLLPTYLLPVTTLDLVLLRKLLVRLLDEFPNNSAWRFIPAAYQFRNPNKPLEEDWPQRINLSVLGAYRSNIEFIGIKVGDLNGSADPASD